MPKQPPIAKADLQKTQGARTPTAVKNNNDVISFINQPSMKEQLAAALPRHMTAERMIRIDKQRQAFDNEHGRYDSDTGAFEFGNDTQHDWSYALAELADGIRGLHPNAGGNSPVIPDGWKLAPEKADEDMIAEGKIMASCMIETVGKIDVSLIYGAMLAAAPEKETGLCTK